MEQKSYSVSQIGNYIKNIFDAEEMLHDIRVFGEITEFKISQGNAWFTIKDENATLSCSLFGAKYLEFIPKVGESVVIKGSPSYWVKSGKLSFVARKIEHIGEGELYLKFLALKEKLQAEGLFDTAHKKQVPNNAINIGVATSETGAVRRDIENVATRRNPAVNIFIAPCKVQGAGADTTIIEALKKLDTMGLDVLIIARGGGSKEDLDCFNSEKLARFIVTLKTPVVSAVGHETDFTICDFVADLRAPTPSASAEIVVANMAGFAEELKLKVIRLKNIINKYFASQCEKLEYMKKQMQASINAKLISYQSVLQTNQLLLANAKNHYFAGLEAKFNNYLVAIQKLNPLAVLSRGYAQIESENNKVIKSVKDIKENSQVNINFCDGSAQAQIISTKIKG